jgi:hypothetical protein
MNKIAVAPSLIADVATYVDAASSLQKEAMDALAASGQDFARGATKLAAAVDVLVRAGSVEADKRAGVIEKAATYEGLAELFGKVAELVKRQGVKIAELSDQHRQKLASPGVAAPQETGKQAAYGGGNSVGAVPQLGEAERKLLNRLTGSNL